MTAKITAKDLADQLNIDAKALRVYLRANAVAKDEETGRYAFNATQVKKHLKDYPAWASHRAEARAAAKAAKEAAAAAQEVEEVADDE